MEEGVRPALALTCMGHYPVSWANMKTDWL